MTASAWSQIWSAFGPFDCDRFASAANRLLPEFCALVHSPCILSVGAFSGPWVGLKAWCHLTPTDVEAILEKVVSEELVASLLLPRQTGSWWWLRVCPDGRHFSPIVKEKLGLAKTDFVAGEWPVPYSLRSGKAMVLNLDGSVVESNVWPVLGYCAIGGCVGCDWKGVL